MNVLAFMKDFKKLRIWNCGMEIATKVFDLTKDFPADQKFELSRQMIKCAISIPSNIAEGSSRSSQKDYMRFIEIALGSSYELETQLIIAKSFHFGDENKWLELYSLLMEEQKMLLAFRNHLSKGLAPRS